MWYSLSILNISTSTIHEKEGSKFDVFRGTSTHIKARSIITKVRSFIPKCHVPSHSSAVSSPLYDNRVSAYSTQERRLVH
jgi:hypothetical protein